MTKTTIPAYVQHYAKTGVTPGLQFTGDIKRTAELIDWTGAAGCYHPARDEAGQQIPATFDILDPTAPSAAPRSVARVGDYIMQDKNGNFYVCPGDVHAGTYTLAAQSTTSIIDAAEAYAAAFDNDPRDCIKADVMNGFYAGVEWLRRAAASHAQQAAVPAAADQRQIFEVEYKLDWRQKRRLSDDSYEDGSVQLAWDAWQKALAVNGVSHAQQAAAPGAAPTA